MNLLEEHNTIAESEPGISSRHKTKRLTYSPMVPHVPNAPPCPVTLHACSLQELPAGVVVQVSSGGGRQHWYENQIGCLCKTCLAKTYVLSSDGACPQCPRLIGRTAGSDVASVSGRRSATIPWRRRTALFQTKIVSNCTYLELEH